MKLFVAGASGSGKTPLARQVADGLGIPHVGASEWVRRLFVAQPPGERQAQIEAMTRFSLEALRSDPFACVAYLERHHDLGRPCVIEGMRNPFDFVRTFDPRTDVVVFLDHRGVALERTAFEGGLDVMRGYVDWLVDVGLLDARRRLVHTFDDIAALDDVIRSVHDVARTFLPDEPPPTARHARVHVDLTPMSLHVREELLYGGDPKFVGGLVPCTVFGFSSYPGSAPTFQILLADGAVFSYIPPSGLVDPTKPQDVRLDLVDLVYHVCPDGDVVVNEHAALAGAVRCWFKHRELWLGGTYRFTVDWYRGNDLLHCVLLDNGQVAFLPNHKIQFHPTVEGVEFRPYKKMRNNWRV